MLPSSPLKSYISGSRLQELQIPSDEESVSSLSVLRGFLLAVRIAAAFSTGCYTGQLTRRVFPLQAMLDDINDTAFQVMDLRNTM